MNCGDTFMIEDDDEAKEHLHVILTKPTVGGEVVTVPICTRRRWSETILCLDVGDHPFIQHASVVAFRHAKIRYCSVLEEAVRQGFARPRERVSAALLRRMQTALIDSDFVTHEVRAFFRDCDLG